MNQQHAPTRGSSGGFATKRPRQSRTPEVAKACWTGRCILSRTTTDNTANTIATRQDTIKLFIAVHSLAGTGSWMSFRRRGRRLRRGVVDAGPGVFLFQPQAVVFLGPIDIDGAAA